MAMAAPRGPTYKVVLLGELGVGKTSLFRRLKDNSYDEKQTATTGIDSCTKIVKVNGESVMVSPTHTVHILYTHGHVHIHINYFIICVSCIQFQLKVCSQLHV